MPVIIQANYPLRLSSSLSSLFKTYYNGFVCSCHGRPYTEVQNQTPFKKRAQVRPDRLCVSNIKQYRWYIMSVTCTNKPKSHYLSLLGKLSSILSRIFSFHYIFYLQEMSFWELASGPGTALLSFHRNR